MPFLRLIDLRSGSPREFEAAEVRVGRDPDVELTISGEGSGVVSGCHLRFVYRVRRWWVEDTGSRNGTFVGGRRLEAGGSEVLTSGSLVRLGKSGPEFKVEIAASRRLDATLTEGDTEASRAVAAAPAEGGPAAQEPPTPTPPGAPQRVSPPPVTDTPSPAAPPIQKSILIVVRDRRYGRRFEAIGPRLRVGRGHDCELRPSTSAEEAVSRTHAEIVLKDDELVVVRDAGSVNGTFLNGEFLAGEAELKPGDRIRLGRAGPILEVDELEVGEIEAGPAGPALRRRRGRSRSGMTSQVVRRVADEVARRTNARTRRFAWSLVFAVAATVVALFIASERRERRTTAALEEQRLALEEQRASLEEYREVLSAQRATTDSLLWAAALESKQIWEQLNVARESAAPAVVVDSLREALAAADQRTRKMEAALARAQESLTRQLAAGDSLRRRAEAEAQRLRGELARARETQVPRGLLDSLRMAVQDAEQQVAGIGQQMRAVAGVNLAALAQANQSAVGLVTAFSGLRIFDGSGFVITPSGYFVTNRHVAQPDGNEADSVFVTMADERFMSRADVIAVAPPGQPDLALIRLRSYSGPHVAKVDWTGTKASQGEPAALIGFPAGLGAALDETRTVRTSMSAGIFSKVTSDVVQFDGFTVEGSSGSPVFNAAGEVVAVHRGSLRGATGLAFAVPVVKLTPLLPEATKVQLGVN